MKYEKPTIEFIILDECDVITLSLGNEEGPEEDGDGF